MSLLAVPIISVLALILSVLLFIIILVLSVKYKAQLTMLVSQYQSQELILNNLQGLNEQLQFEVENLHKKGEKTTTENLQISKQLEHRIKTLQTQINNQNDIISQLQTDKGDDKFYTRAIKLAKKGADIDEIVNECELPYAEVEMLISVYQKETPS